MSTNTTKSKRSKWLPLWIFLFLICTVVLQHAFLFVFIALLPSIVAYIIDNKEGRPIFTSVVSLNFAGLSPFLFDMGVSGNYLSQASALMGSVYIWFVIYAAAALGWLLVLICPACTALILKTIRGSQIAHLEKQQRKLTEEWGPEIQRKE
jgi:hypothetical protein